MSKKKTKKNTTLEILNKINVLNRRINKQRKKVINNIKTSYLGKKDVDLPHCSIDSLLSSEKNLIVL